jgi:hypothetical protein
MSFSSRSRLGYLAAALLGAWFGRLTAWFDPEWGFSHLRDGSLVELDEFVAVRQEPNKSMNISSSVIDALGSPHIAHWNAARTEISASLSVDRKLRSSIEQACKESKQIWCDITEKIGRKCSICHQVDSTTQKLECKDGSLFFLAGATEENQKMMEDWHTWQYMEEFIKLFHSSLVYQIDSDYPMVSSHLKCVFEKPNDKAFRAYAWLYLDIELLEPFDSTKPLKLLVNSPVPDSTLGHLKDQIVVCGRVLFNQVSAKSLALHVNHNVGVGIPITIVYETGSSVIEDRYLLDPYIRSGNLVVVDLRNTMQLLYGQRSLFTVWNTKAFMQQITRKDCFDRVQQINPKWVGFLDLDEYISSPEVFESKANKLVDAIELYMVAPKTADRFCKDPLTKVLPGGPANVGLTKFFLRPSTAFETTSVHWLNPTRGFIPPKVRVVPLSEAFLFHVRCANDNMN